MKRFILILTLILLIVAALIIGRNILNSHPVSVSQQKEIAEVVNNYYKALENNETDKALSYVYYNENNMNNYVNPISNKLALEEIIRNIYSTFHLDSLCNYQYIFYDKQEKAYFASVNLNLKYKETSGGIINEILYLNKIHNTWEIIKIKTSDRYVIYRSGEYNVDSNVFFLQPSKQ